MGRTPKETTQITQRRQRVAELYVKGWFQTAIARELAMSQPTVCQDLQAIRKQWRESAIRDFDAARELELQKLDRVEREAWAAWERSQQPAQSAVVSGDGAGQHTHKSLHTQHGDLRALDTVLKCNAARRSMLGLDAPTRIAPVMPDGREPFRLAVAHLSVSELRALKNLRDRVLTVTPEQEHEPEELSSEHDARVD
jgi:hypothetical protein